MTSRSILGCALLCASLAAKADVQTITASSLGNWTVTTSDSSVTSSFVTGPATPPLGAGSAQFQIGPDGDSYIILRDDADIAGTPISALTQLAYSTYQQQYLDGQAVYLSLVLSNGDRTYFEPVYQNGGYGGDSVPNQCAGVTNCAGLNQWQTWNALSGGWWDLSGFNGSNGGPPVFTLADFAAANPDLTISAIRLVAGGGAGAWDNFKGNADNLTFATASESKTFDFEASVPEPSALILLTIMIVGPAVLGLRKKKIV